MALVFKVLTLTIRTIAKPMASHFERAILNHPAARARVISLAQVMHRLEVAITRGAEGKIGRVFVGDMTEERAVELASRIVSEGFIYTTALSLVTWEAVRKNREDEAKAVKEAASRAAIQELHRRHLQAETDLHAQQEELRSLVQSIDERLERLEDRQTADDARKLRRSWSIL